MFSDQDADGFTFQELELMEAIHNPPEGPLDLHSQLVWPAYTQALQDDPWVEVWDGSGRPDPYNLQ